ncbi:MAG: hypothetical protein V1738_03270 [Patescibacteria group bacterium]
MRLAMVLCLLTLSACNPNDERPTDADVDTSIIDADIDPADADSDAEVDAEDEPQPTCDGLPADADRVQLLACCLAERGVWLYHTFWCTYCYIQQRMFGEYFILLNQMECYDEATYTELPECTALGIEGYPAWSFPIYDETTGEQIDTVIIEGLMHYSLLAEYSGCVWE